MRNYTMMRDVLELVGSSRRPVLFDDFISLYPTACIIAPLDTVGSSGAYNIMRTGISGADAATSTLDMAGSDNLQSTFDDATHIGGDLNETSSRRRASRGKSTGPNTGIAIGLGMARNFNSLYELLRDEKAGNPTVTWYSKNDN